MNKYTYKWNGDDYEISEDGCVTDPKDVCEILNAHDALVKQRDELLAGLKSIMEADATQCPLDDCEFDNIHTAIANAEAS